MMLGFSKLLFLAGVFYLASTIGRIPEARQPDRTPDTV
jgi:hypothetical protein